MKFTPAVEEMILNADGKALGTNGPHGLNVVPVSSVRIVDGNIWLINYFFGKTLENILKDKQVALACWKGLEGYQIKGHVSYFEGGEAFEEARSWIAEILPERMVNGLLILEPEEIFDVSPAANG